MKKVVKLLIPVAFAFSVSVTAFAQNPGDPYIDDPDASVPLDEGLLTVLVSGAAIGVSKLVVKTRKK